VEIQAGGRRARDRVRSPADQRRAGSARRADHIVTGVRDGDLTAADGSELSNLVDHYLRALQAKDFEWRLHMLQSESAKDRGKPDDAS
jgi:hypothetical protein